MGFSGPPGPSGEPGETGVIGETVSSVTISQSLRIFLSDILIVGTQLERFSIECCETKTTVITLTKLPLVEKIARTLTTKSKYYRRSLAFIIRFKTTR